MDNFADIGECRAASHERDPIQFESDRAPNSLILSMILSEKSATFRDHALSRIIVREKEMPFPRASKALSRFTVLDLTRVRSGPTCVRQLADWGANVIKI